MNEQILMFSIICVIIKKRNHGFLAQELGFNGNEFIKRVKVLNWRLTGLNIMKYDRCWE